MTDADRLNALEVRVVHQDEIIEDLNAAVTKQWTVIDRLTREVRALNERAAATGLSGADKPGDEPPPPHY